RDGYSTGRETVIVVDQNSLFEVVGVRHRETEDAEQQVNAFIQVQRPTQRLNG
ncbi:hypothetical protein GBAR_LOCUS10622, partial [Geodia barretti]